MDLTKEIEIPKEENVIICERSSIKNRLEPRKSLQEALDLIVNATIKANRKIQSHSVHVGDEGAKITGETIRMPITYYLITVILEPIGKSETEEKGG